MTLAQISRVALCESGTHFDSMEMDGGDKYALPLTMQRVRVMIQDKALTLQPLQLEIS